ncbi:hypothetical protein O9X94_19440 [Agrobacterium leguminum]|uniref:Uncharacterized protein n=1 Tax=Agrobacterium leguminum TaxID=2792015 RepID=A0A9X3KGX6_9HYPH|nr:hypothetical protein [Agrobacterium leguminum]MCZ7911503.1 hypothetical protein [Agrobacterium leguminum]
MQLIISGQPREFTPSEGTVWEIDGDAGRISVRAPALSDIFIAPHKGGQPTAASRHNAALLMTNHLEGDFQFGATVNVEFAAAFDAGIPRAIRVQPAPSAKAAMLAL